MTIECNQPAVGYFLLPHHRAAYYYFCNIGIVGNPNNEWEKDH